MNKGELIEAVASTMESSKSEASKAVEAVIEAIAGGLKSEDRVAIAGFGTFVKKHRAAREGVNPATGQRMTIGPSTTASFKPATALKSAI